MSPRTLSSVENKTRLVWLSISIPAGIDPMMNPPSDDPSERLNLRTYPGGPDAPGGPACPLGNDARHSRPWPASWIPEAPGSEWFPSSAGLLGGGRLAEGEMPAAPPDLTRIGSPAGTLW